MKALPAKIRELRGTNKNHKGKKVGMEIENVETIPIAPKEYSQEQKELWFDVCSILHSVGLLQSIGIYQIKNYCRYHKIHSEALDDIEKRGNIIIQETNYGITEKVNPSLTVAQNTFASMQSIADRFGFTPVAQSKIKEIGLLGKEKPKDKDDEFGNL